MKIKGRKGRLRKAWIRFLAWSHLSEKAVCEMSKGMGLCDYHDWVDDDAGQPWNFDLMKCRRCGKKFMI